SSAMNPRRHWTPCQLKRSRICSSGCRKKIRLCSSPISSAKHVVSQTTSYSYIWEKSASSDPPTQCCCPQRNSCPNNTSKVFSAQFAHHTGSSRRALLV